MNSKIPFDCSKNPFVIGSSRSLRLTCTVLNTGETAFMTQLSIIATRFLTIPSNCQRQLTENFAVEGARQELICNVVSGGILYRNDRTQLEFVLDTSVLTVPSLMVNVSVWSAGDERDDTDNRRAVEVPLVERSTLEIVGFVSTFKKRI